MTNRSAGELTVDGAGVAQPSSANVHLTHATAAAEELQLVTGLRNGDEQAFAALLDRYHPSLVRLARLYVAEPATAEDVVQETWLGVVRGIGRFEGRSTLRTWLCRILMNRARTRRREASTLPFSALEDPHNDAYEPAVDPQRFRGDGHWLDPPCSPEDVPEDRLLAKEAGQRLRDAVDALPPAQREVVTLRDVEGWTAAEVCALLQISDANQRVLLHRGRSKVRATLEQYLAEERNAPVLA